MHDIAMKDSHAGILTTITNMEDWVVSKCSSDYYFMLMIQECLQGQCFPVNKVDQLLIINPLSSFEKVWNIIKLMLSKKLLEKGSHDHGRWAWCSTLS
jgi:hypothetical protein